MLYRINVGEETGVLTSLAGVGAARLFCTGVSHLRARESDLPRDKSSPYTC